MTITVADETDRLQDVCFRYELVDASDVPDGIIWRPVFDGATVAYSGASVGAVWRREIHPDGPRFYRLVRVFL